MSWRGDQFSFGDSSGLGQECDRFRPSFACSGFKSVGAVANGFAATGFQSELNAALFMCPYINSVPKTTNGIDAMTTVFVAGFLIDLYQSNNSYDL